MKKPCSHKNTKMLKETIEKGKVVYLVRCKKCKAYLTREERNQKLF